MSGSIDGYVYEVMRETEPDLIAQTRVVQQSELLGFPPIACSAAAANDTRTQRLRSALVRMGDDPDGRAVLAMLRLDGFAVEDPSLFDPIAAEVASSGERRVRTARVPLAIRVPAVVLVFMAAVAVFISERVLTRLQEAQARHLGDLATVYLDGLAPALVAPVVREDVWEVFDIVDRARQIHAGLKPTETVVATADGRVLASSDPRLHPSWSPLPSSFLAERAAAPAILSDDEDGKAVARRDLLSGDRVVGSVHATFDIAPLLAERRSVLLTLIGTNAALTLALALTAWLTVRRMMRPVRILASHLKASPDCPVEAIPDHLVESLPGSSVVSSRPSTA